MEGTYICQFLPIFQQRSICPSTLLCSTRDGGAGCRKIQWSGRQIRQFRRQREAKKTEIWACMQLSSLADAFAISNSQKGFLRNLQG